jgi:putative membrane protein
MATADRASQTDHHAPRFEVATKVETHLAWLQSRMSTERTLMSCVRTATALIGFGFTIVQFFNQLNAMNGIAPAARPEMPRVFGLALIAAGTLFLIVALYQYRTITRYLWSRDYRPIAGIDGKPFQAKPAAAIAVLLVLVGIFAFGAVLLRLD